LQAVIRSEPERVAVSVPTAYDYFVAFDPARYVSEWDNSVLGSSLGAVWDPAWENTVYEAYKSLLFPEPFTQSAHLFDMEKYKAILDEGAEYIYVGKETLTDGGWEKKCDLYEVKLTSQAPSNLINTLAADLASMLPGNFAAQVTSQAQQLSGTLGGYDPMTLRVYVAGGKVAGMILGTNGELAVYFKGTDINMEEINLRLTTPDAGVSAQVFIQMKNADTLIFNGKADFWVNSVESFTCNWNLNWDNTITAGDNFVLHFTLDDSSQSGMSLSAAGKLLAGPDRLTAEFDSIVFNSEITGAESMVDISLEASIIPDTGEIEPADGARELSSVTEMDVLEIIMKIMSDPQLAMLLEQLS
jgi:hypothetical protein